MRSCLTPPQVRTLHWLPFQARIEHFVCFLFFHDGSSMCTPLFFFFFFNLNCCETQYLTAVYICVAWSTQDFKVVVFSLLFFSLFTSKTWGQENHTQVTSRDSHHVTHSKNNSWLAALWSWFSAHNPSILSQAQPMIRYTLLGISWCTSPYVLTNHIWIMIHSSDNLFCKMTCWYVSL